jgi:WD40 repeat protein
MSAGRWSGGLVAAVMLAVGLLSLYGAFLALGLGDRTDDSASPLTSLPSGNADSLARVAIFLVAGLFLLAYAWRRWTRGAANQVAPVFGRNARPIEKPRSRFSWLDGLIAVIVIGVLVDHFFAPWRPTPPLDGPRDAIAVEAEPGNAVPLEAETVTESEPEQEVASHPVAGEPQDGTAPIDEPEDEAGPGANGLAALEPAGNDAESNAIPQSGSDEAPRENPGPPLPSLVAPSRTVAPQAVPPPQPTRPDGHAGSVVWLSLAADGKTLLSASTDHTIKLWDIESARLTRTLGAHGDMARAALFMPDGVHALTAGDDGEIVLRSLEDGSVVHVFAAHAHGSANKIAVSPDGRLAVSVHRSGSVIVWDIAERAVRHVLAGHAWPVVSVAMSPDGHRAVSGSIDGALKLWDVETGRQTRDWLGHERGVYGAAFMADGRRLVTGSGDFTIKLWDVETGEEIRRFTGHSGTVYALVLSEDESRILSGSLDGTARIWDIETGREIAQFAENGGPIYAVAFAADGSALTGARNGAIRAWPPDGDKAVMLFPAAGE